MISDLVNCLLSCGGSTFIKMVELVQPWYSSEISTQLLIYLPICFT